MDTNKKTWELADEYKALAIKAHKIYLNYPASWEVQCKREDTIDKYEVLHDFWRDIARQTIAKDIDSMEVYDDNDDYYEGYQ